MIQRMNRSFVIINIFSNNGYFEFCLSDIVIDEIGKREWGKWNWNPNTVPNSILSNE